MAGETELWPLRLQVIEADTDLVGRLVTHVGEADRALALVFGYLLPAFAVALLLALFLREIPLSDVAGMVARGGAVTGDDDDRWDDDAREAAPACWPCRPTATPWPGGTDVPDAAGDVVRLAREQPSVSST
jgi:hypothetical protein